MSNLLRNIGNTPLLELRRILPEGCAMLHAKGEFLNPSGSIKDRIAKAIIETAERTGAIKPGSTILEVTSGNTGIAFSMVGAEKGYKVVIMMPRSATHERRKMIEFYGARLELIEDLRQLQHAVEVAVELAKKDPTIFLPRQFSNPGNAKAHEEGTGREILEQAGSKVDAFVMGVGTGGTLMGVGRALRKANPNVLVVAVEPAESAVMSGEKPGCHGIQGLADGFIPEIVKMDEVSRVMKVGTQEAIDMARRLVKEEGLFVGISSGANVCAAIRIAKELGPGKRVVTALPDRGERYLSIF